MKKNITLLFVLLGFLLWSVTIRAESAVHSNEKNDIPMLCVTPIKFKDGYYVGVAAGYDVYKIKDSIAYQDFDTFREAKTNPELAANGMIGDFILGYGKLLGKNSNVYLGIELFANGSAADSDFQTNVPSVPVIIDTDLVINGSFGLGVTPGLRINKTSIIYLKVGYNWSTVSLDETVRSEDDFELNSVEYHDEVTINGLLYGVGLESAFNEQFNLRIEYTHSLYGSITSTSDARIASSRNQFLLGLIYRFNS